MRMEECKKVRIKALKKNHVLNGMKGDFIRKTESGRMKVCIAGKMMLLLPENIEFLVQDSNENASVINKSEKKKSSTHLLDRGDEGILGSKSGGLFTGSSQFGGLLSKLSSIGAVDTDYLKNLPGLVSALDLNKIKSASETSPDGRSGVSAMMDINVSKVLADIETMKTNSEQSSDPAFVSLLALAELYKQTYPGQ